MKFTKIGEIAEGQDGAIWNQLLFRLDEKGNCYVCELDTLEETARFQLDGTDEWMPHSNAVMFGCEYFAEGDEFPLLYTNVYNTYSKEDDRREGVCCVYRITRQGDSFRGQLVQVITVGFTKDKSLWCSEDGDLRPYGNFVIDREKGIYYGFTMRDMSRTTPYFAFKLPRLSQGRYVTLTVEDILFSFECPYHWLLQGACTYKGKIISLEGYRDDTQYRPALRIIDTENQEQLRCEYLIRHELVHEPEFIDFWEDVCYYGDARGNLYKIEEIEYV